MPCYESIYETASINISRGEVVDAPQFSVTIVLPQIGKPAARLLLPRAAQLFQSAAQVLEEVAVSGLGDVDRLS